MEASSRILEYLLAQDYGSLVLITVVIYDYFLTFSRELDYVWFKPWTRISTMFLVVRYVGLSLAILGGLAGTSFVSGPVTLYGSEFWLRVVLIIVPQIMTCEHSKGTSITVAVFWLYTVFLAATDLVMTAWVYTMWNQSKRVLGVLLFIYVPQVIFSFVVVGILSAPNTYFTVTVQKISGSSFCDVSESRNYLLSVYPLGVRLPLGIILLVLAVTQTLKQSVQMYRATKQWQPNKYMQLFVKDGIYYFLANIFIDLASLTADPVLLGIVFGLSCISLIPLIPRFIIGVRELYDHGTRRVHRQRIDTVFGVLSQSISYVDSTIVFRDVTTGQIVEGETDGLETIHLEALEDNSGLVSKDPEGPGFRNLLSEP